MEHWPRPRAIEQTTASSINVPFAILQIAFIGLSMWTHSKLRWLHAVYCCKWTTKHTHTLAAVSGPRTAPNRTMISTASVVLAGMGGHLLFYDFLWLNEACKWILWLLWPSTESCLISKTWTLSCFYPQNQLECETQYEPVLKLHIDDNETVLGRNILV